jgi:hypothetical protein
MGEVFRWCFAAVTQSLKVVHNRSALLVSGPVQTGEIGDLRAKRGSLSAQKNGPLVSSGTAVTFQRGGNRTPLTAEIGDRRS